MPENTADLSTTRKIDLAREVTGVLSSENLPPPGVSDLDIAGVPGTAGMAVRSAVYMKSDGTLALANAGAMATMPVHGFVVAETAAGVYTIRRDVSMSGFSGLTPGAAVWAAKTNGAITTTKPDTAVEQIVGTAQSASVLDIEIDRDLFDNTGA